MISRSSPFGSSLYIYPTIDFTPHNDTGIVFSEYYQTESIKSETVNVSSKKYS